MLCVNPYKLHLKTETHKMYSLTYTSHFKGKETSLQLGNCANSNINQTEIQSLAVTKKRVIT